MASDQIKAAEKPKGETKVTRYEAENIAIKALEQAKFSEAYIYGDREVQEIAREFGNRAVEEGYSLDIAKERVAPFIEERKDELGKEAPAKEEGEVFQMEQASITAKPPLTDAERRNKVIAALEEARGKTEDYFKKREREHGLPIPGSSRSEPGDISLAQKEIEAQKKYRKWQKENPEGTLAMYRMEQRGKKPGETVQPKPIEPEYEIAQREPVEEEEPVQKAPKEETEEDIAKEPSGDVMVFQQEELNADAEKFIKDELGENFIKEYSMLKKEHDIARSPEENKEEYKKLETKYSATGPELEAKISILIAENATKGVEKLKTFEAKFKSEERFETQHDAFDRYVGKVRGSALSALDATASARNQMGTEEAAPTRKPVSDENVERLLAIIDKNTGQQPTTAQPVAEAPAAEETMEVTPKEVAKYEKEHPPTAPVAEEPKKETSVVAKAPEETTGDKIKPGDIYHPDENIRKSAIEAAAKEAPPAVSEAPAEEPVKVAATAVVEKKPPVEEIIPEPPAVAKAPEEILPVEEVAKAEPVKEEEDSRKAAIKDKLLGLDFGEKSKVEKDVLAGGENVRDDELANQVETGIVATDEVGALRGPAKKEPGEAAKIEPERVAEKAETKKDRAVAHLMESGGEPVMGKLVGGTRVKKAEKETPVGESRSVLDQLSSEQQAILTDGTDTQKKELKAELITRRDREEKALKTYKTREGFGDKVKSSEKTIKDLGDLIKRL